jgi:hypothetical protein
MAPVLVLIAVLLAIPLWSVTRVEVVGGEYVPRAAVVSLGELVGHSVLTLDLDWPRQVAENWPSTAEVRVRLDLPGTLVVEIFPETIRGSMAVGGSWHAVGPDGRLAGALSEPTAPLLEGFRRPSDRRQAFATARRLSRVCGGTVSRIRKITPADFRVDLSFGEERAPLVVHVNPAGSDAEELWCAGMASREEAVGWADLRWDHRVVIRAGEALRGAG